MLSEEAINKIAERLVNRIEQANEYVMQTIGESIKTVGSLSKSDIHKLVLTMKFGGDYDRIIKYLADVTELNVKDIQQIFEEVAKNDYAFAKQFYEYRDIKYIPFEQNIALQNKVNALAEITAKEYIKKTHERVLGLTFRGLDGELRFRGLKEAYFEILDMATVNVSQGTETFNQAMYRLMKQVGGNGIKVQYEGDYVRRLDSTVRMHLRDGLSNLHTEIQKDFGKEFKANGVEVTVHENPAPDHADVQGKQFANKQFDNFQNDKEAKSYDGVVFPPEFEGRDRRAIGQYNCYHDVYSIVLGVSKPEYSNEELKEIKDRNEKGFEFEGKHYTNYEGTQLQRRIESAIRNLKDTNVLAKAGGNNELIDYTYSRIDKLVDKYNGLSVASGLPTRMDKLRATNYRGQKKKKNK